MAKKIENENNYLDILADLATNRLEKESKIKSNSQLLNYKKLDISSEKFRNYLLKHVFGIPEKKLGIANDYLRNLSANTPQKEDNPMSFLHFTSLSSDNNVKITPKVMKELIKSIKRKYVKHSYRSQRFRHKDIYVNKSTTIVHAKKNILTFNPKKDEMQSWKNDHNYVKRIQQNTRRDKLQNISSAKNISEKSDTTAKGTLTVPKETGNCAINNFPSRLNTSKNSQQELEKQIALQYIKIIEDCIKKKDDTLLNALVFIPTSTPTHSLYDTDNNRLNYTKTVSLLKSVFDNNKSNDTFSPTNNCCNSLPETILNIASDNGIDNVIGKNAPKNIGIIDQNSQEASQIMIGKRNLHARLLPKGKQLHTKTKANSSENADISSLESGNINEDNFSINLPIEQQSISKNDALEIPMTKTKSSTTFNSTTKRYWTCALCPHKAYTASASLLSHYRSHAGIKPYACNECGNRFTRRHSLEYHALCHAKVLPFTCPTCQRGFRHRSHFKEHLRKHTGETPYTCIQCGHAFKTRNTYKRHLRARHYMILSAKGIRSMNPSEIMALEKSENLYITTMNKASTVPLSNGNGTQSLNDPIISSVASSSINRNISNNNTNDNNLLNSYLQSISNIKKNKNS